MIAQNISGADDRGPDRAEGGEIGHPRWIAGHAGGEIFGNRFLIDSRIAILLQNEDEPRHVIELIETGVRRESRALEQQPRGGGDE